MSFNTWMSLEGKSFHLELFHLALETLTEADKSEIGITINNIAVLLIWSSVNWKRWRLKNCNRYWLQCGSSEWLETSINPRGGLWIDFLRFNCRQLWREIHTPDVHHTRYSNLKEAVISFWTYASHKAMRLLSANSYYFLRNSWLDHLCRVSIIQNFTSWQVIGNNVCIMG